MIAQRALATGLIVSPTQGFVACESKPWESKPGLLLAAPPRVAEPTASERLARLFRDDELILHCQEVVRLNAGIDAPLLLDVSIRSRSEEDGQTTPGLFLSLIEDGELMAEFDRLVREALSTGAGAGGPGAR